MEAADTKQLNDELADTIRKAERGRKIVTWSKIPLYGLTLAYFVFIWTTPFMAARYGESAGQVDMVKYIVPLFAVIFVSQFVFMRAYHYFARKETEIMERIMKTLFPDVKYSGTAPKGVSVKTLKKSKILGTIESSAGTVPAFVFATLQMKVDDLDLTLADIGVSPRKIKDRIGQNIPILGGMYLALKSVIKPLVSARVDSAAYGFRGMFAWAELPKDCGGNVLVLPDHLEDKIGYLAHSVQSLRTIEGTKLVKMEDPEFERRFAVYADDEVVARYVLTPAMMRRITMLKSKFGRDIMLSFCQNGFYMAVSMPDGFLNLRGGSLTHKNIVEEIYEDVTTAVAVLGDLKIK